MPKLRREAERLKNANRSDATLRAYAADWKNFAAWCRAAGRTPLPATSETIQLYIVDALKTRKISTVERRLAAIAKYHRVGGHKSPIDEDVRAVLSGAQRKRPNEVTQKAAITPQQLARMSRAMPRNAIGLRDRAILVLGFATGCRREELAALKLSDVQFVAKGIRVKIRKAKNDQRSQGREVGVFRGIRSATCPVTTLKAWLYVRGKKEGPLFTAIDPAGNLTARAIRGAAIAATVQRAAERIGLDPANYGGHSLRAGMVTAAAENGAAETLIMQRSGHRSRAMIATYIRPATLFQVDVLKRAL